MGTRHRIRTAMLVFLLLTLAVGLLVFGVGQPGTDRASASPVRMIALPQLIARSPAVDASGVPLDATIVAQFSQDMNPMTLNLDSFTLAKIGGGQVPCSLTYYGPTRTATLIPSSPLEPNTTYVATLTNTIAATSGAPLALAPIWWKFTTVQAPPVVTAISPADASIDMPVDQTISITIDQDIDLETLSTATFYVARVDSPPLPGVVTWDAATRTAHLVPVSPLLPGTVYWVTLSPLVTGMNGLGVAGAPILWHFITAAVQPPHAATIFPANSSADQPLNVIPSVTFDADMDASTINASTFTITKVGSETLAATVNYSPATRTATITPTGNLLPETGYFLTLTGDIRGANGVALGGAPLSWAFTTTNVPPTFSDVTTDNPFATAISDLAARHIINGFDDGTFRPAALVTRQQFAKMIVLTMGYQVSEKNVCPFTDVVQTGPGHLVDPTDPLYPDHYIAVAALHGVTTGKTATTFAPGQNISRYQVITMVVRAIDDVRPGVLLTPPASFKSTWDPALSSVHGQNARKAEYNGLLAGLTLEGMDPTAPMPRGEVAQILWNALFLIK